MARFCENVDDYSHKEDFTRPGQVSLALGALT